jgi:hypothetical protein
MMSTSSVLLPGIEKVSDWPPWLRLRPGHSTVEINQFCVQVARFSGLMRVERAVAMGKMLG